MNDSIAINSQGAGRSPGAWLLLIHQIPPKPDYFRVKVRRRLQGIGAVALKNSVYALPHREDTAEDFAWLAREIVAEGGEATVCDASFVVGVTDAEVEAMFQAERDADYAEIERAAAAPDADAARLRRRLAEVAAIDFFGAPGRAGAERAVAAVDARTAGGEAGSATAPAPSADVRGRTWVTRERVYVDRLASAWLIRRFIDAEARFKFVPAKGYRPEPGELRFDMYQGEFTHDGDRCTFEVLLARFDLTEPALRALGEIVHDIDIKDGKFGRPEAPGVASLVQGLALAHADDAARVAQGAPLFDALYAQLAASAPPGAKAHARSNTIR